MDRSVIAEVADDIEVDLQAQFARDVLAGLSQDRKAIPARWFYDRRGSELFEQITELPEYYLTRTEEKILADCCPRIVEKTGKGRAVIEFGAGSAAKTPLLLNCIEASCYVPIDISGDFLRESCRELQRRFARLPIHPVEADFTRPVVIPAELHGHNCLGFFPGSTIGNMQPHSAADLLRVMRETLGAGSMLLIGMDMIKDRATLLSAYDDAAGVTAAFNLNLPHRINRELDGTVPLDAFRHRSVWNDERARIEMHLEATRDIRFRVLGHDFTMRRGETIHTENSHKYDMRSADLLLRAGGWDPIRPFFGEETEFRVILARAAEEAVTP